MSSYRYSVVLLIIHWIRHVIILYALDHNFSATPIEYFITAMKNALISLNDHIIPILIIVRLYNIAYTIYLLSKDIISDA